MHDCRQLSCIPLLIAGRGEMQAHKLLGNGGEVGDAVKQK